MYIICPFSIMSIWRDMGLCSAHIHVLTSPKGNCFLVGEEICEEILYEVKPSI